MSAKSPLGAALIKELCDLLDLLGDEKRLKIILALLDGPRNVGQLCIELGLMQPTVSHHLSLLRHCKVITNVRKGKEVHYSLNAEYLERLGDAALDQWPGGKGEIRAGKFLLKRVGRAAKG
jgi:DNA-binding transcriptional ArsR family regulator